jgi:hypothetical protein
MIFGVAKLPRGRQSGICAGIFALIRILELAPAKYLGLGQKTSDPFRRRNSPMASLGYLVEKTALAYPKDVTFCMQRQLMSRTT